MSLKIMLPRHTIVGGAAIIAIGVVGVAAFYYFPAATITIHPATETHSVTRAITLLRDGEPDYVHFQLPARIIEAESTEKKIFERSGATTHDDLARGQVLLTNELEEEQQLLPRTHLRHEATGTFFLTDSPVVIPAKGTTTVSVTAQEAGSQGNVPAGRFVIDKLPAAAQTAVYGTSAYDFTGGVVIDSPLSQDELQNAREEVMTILRERIRGEITAQAKGAAVRDDLMVITPHDEQVSATVGSKAQTFSIALSVTARVFVVDENDLLSLTLLALRQDTSQETELVSYAPESFSVSIERVDFEHGRALVVGSLKGIFAPKVEPSVFRSDNLAGRTEAEVRDYLLQFSSIKAVDVHFSPFWVKRVPAREGAVNIQVETHSP